MGVEVHEDPLGSKNCILISINITYNMFPINQVFLNPPNITTLSQQQKIHLYALFKSSRNSNNIKNKNNKNKVNPKCAYGHTYNIIISISFHSIV